jgi:hypothetical protein
VAKKKKDTEEEAPALSTKQVAEIVSEEIGDEIDPKQLRIYIRDSDIFGGQRNKRYAFEGEDDPKIEELIEYIKERRTAKKSTEDEEGTKPPRKKKKSKKSKKKKALRKKATVEDDEDEEE